MQMYAPSSALGSSKSWCAQSESIKYHAGCSESRFSSSKRGIHLTKFMLLGLDSAIPSLVSRYFAQGKLPHMKALAANGAWSEVMPAFPSHTAANWNTIATGAWPSTHGVTDMVVHLPGTPLTEIVSGFYSHLCRAEQIWKTAERVGKKSILMKYIGSWPPNAEKGIVQVEGFGAPGGPGSRPWGSSPLAISNSSCYATQQLDNSKLMNFERAVVLSSSSGDHSDSNSPKSHSALASSTLPPMQAEIKIGPPDNPVGYNVIAFASPESPKRYDRTLVVRRDDDNNGVVLKKGQLSEWLVDNFRVNGKSVRAAFRMRLTDIDGNSRTERDTEMGNGRQHEYDVSMKLFVSQIFPLEGWTYPGSLALELVNRFGPFLESISHFPFVFGWADENAYLEDLEYQARWMGNASEYLMAKHDWDLYMTQWHGIDNTQHAFLRFDKSVLSEYESELSDKVVLRSYEIADEFVGHVAKAGNSVTTARGAEDVYTFVLSDHGHVMGKRRFFINQYLYDQGLIKLRRDHSTGKITVDWDRTQAFAQGMVSVYVNLKGREPNGSVAPGKEYDEVVERLIDLLYDVKDPKTGQRPVHLALNNRDSEYLGLTGDRTGDVVFAVNPVYVSDNRMRFSGDLFENLKTGLPDGSIHGQQLPSVDLREYGTIRSLLIAHGPNIKKGHVLDRPVKMVDIAPTIAYLLDMPAPKNCEGAVIRELLQ
jgi:predicted AlkP superfamily phosphohydrolase/phosphomutase